MEEETTASTTNYGDTRSMSSHVTARFTVYSTPEDDRGGRPPFDSSRRSHSHSTGCSSRPHTHATVRRSASAHAAPLPRRGRASPEEHLPRLSSHEVQTDSDDDDDGEKDDYKAQEAAQEIA